MAFKELFAIKHLEFNRNQLRLAGNRGSILWQETGLKLFVLLQESV